MKQPKVKFNLKEPTILLSRRNSINDLNEKEKSDGGANVIRLNSNVPILSESLIRKIELSRQTNQTASLINNNSSSLPLLSKSLNEPHSILKTGAGNKSKKFLKVKLNTRDVEQHQQNQQLKNANTSEIKKLNKLKLDDKTKSYLIKPNSNSLNSFEFHFDEKQKFNNKLYTRRVSNDDTIFQRTSKIPVPKKNKKGSTEKDPNKKFSSKPSENSRKSSLTPRSSPSTQTDEFYLPRDVNHNNQHLASDILLKSISATPTVKLLDHSTTSGLVGKGLLFNHFDELDDLEFTDENFNDEFLSNFNNSNFIRNNKLFYDSLTSNSFGTNDLTLDKLLLDDFRKRLSQINEESSDRSSLISRTKWSSSLSQLSNNDLNTTNVNNQAVNNTNASSINNIHKNNNKNSTDKIINKPAGDIFGRPIHRHLNRTFSKLI